MNKYRLVVRDSNIDIVYKNNIKNVIFDITINHCDETHLDIIYNLVKQKFATNNYHFFLSQTLEIDKEIEILEK